MHRSGRALPHWFLCPCRQALGSSCCSSTTCQPSTGWTVTSSPQLRPRGGHPLRHIMCTPFHTMGELHVSRACLHLVQPQGRAAPELQDACMVIGLGELHVSCSEVLYNLSIGKRKVRCMQLSLMKQPAQPEDRLCCCANHTLLCTKPGKCCCAQYALLCTMSDISDCARCPALYNSGQRQRAERCQPADTLPQPMTPASFRCSCCQARLSCF